MLRIKNVLKVNSFLQHPSWQWIGLLEVKKIRLQMYYFYL